MAFGKKSQMSALSNMGPGRARQASQDDPFETEEGDPDGSSVGSSALGSQYGEGLDQKRDEGQTKHVGRIGDLNASPEPKLSKKPYGSDDGQNPDQAKSRGERSKGAISNTRLARSENPGGKGLLHSGNPGSDQGATGLNAKRSERGEGLGARGMVIPPNYKRGAGSAGPKKG